MSDVEFNNLSEGHIDMLSEIGNIGAGNANTALSLMLNKRIDMDVPVVKITNFDEISEVLGGAENPVVGILIHVSGNVNGMMIVVIEQASAHKLVNMLMSKEINEFESFTQMDLSALCEIGNILASSYLSSLATMTGLTMEPSVPHLAIDMAGAILSVPAIEFGKIDDRVLLIKTEFLEGGESVLGNYILLPDPPSFTKILTSLGATL